MPTFAVERFASPETYLMVIMPPPRRGGGRGALSGDRRPSSVCLSVCLSVRCPETYLMVIVNCILPRQTRSRPVLITVVHEHKLCVLRLNNNYTVFQKHVTTFLMISWSRTVGLERFLAHLLLRVQAIDRFFLFSHLTYFLQLLYLGKLSRPKYQQN